MKYQLLAFMLLFSLIAKAQDTTDVHVDSPKIVTKLLLDNIIEVGEFEIKFIDVVNDSRCPRYVNCVRAGEAKVQFHVSKNGETIKNEVVDITPSTYLQNDYPVILNYENIKVEIYNVLPYPEYSSKINKSDYYLQLIITKD
ncbi:hypothetical protein [Hanstruepera marina]|uniref:hypothetical protein n=1 Tax=Hanstruepera marina TaxID=2873265 RepID=UPI001CA6CDA2|nr:hypothetical protein [Hanstruepera marina]